MTPSSLMIYIFFSSIPANLQAVASYNRLKICFNINITKNINKLIININLYSFSVTEACEKGILLIEYLFEIFEKRSFEDLFVIKIYVNFILIFEIHTSAFLKTTSLLKDERIKSGDKSKGPIRGKLKIILIKQIFTIGKLKVVLF